MRFTFRIVYGEKYKEYYKGIYEVETEEVVYDNLYDFLSSAIAAFEDVVVEKIFGCLEDAINDGIGGRGNTLYYSGTITSDTDIYDGSNWSFEVEG
jgi:hypothetical protein